MTADLAATRDYRAILETISDGIVITDGATGVILAANPAFCRMHGHEDMVGMHPADFISASSIPAFVAQSTAATRGEGYRGRVEHLHRDGSRLDVEVTRHPFVYDESPAMLGVIRDITDQVRSEQELERRVEDRTQQLESLLQVARAVASTLDLTELVRLILDQVREVVEYNAASLILIEDDELVIHDLLIEGENGLEPQPSGLRFSLSALPRSASEAESRPRSLRYPCVQVAASSEFWERMRDLEPVVIDDVLQSPGRMAEDYRTTMGAMLLAPDVAYMRTWMAMPLAVKGQVIGYIGMSSDLPGYFTERHARLTRAFADHAAIAIENARLHERARHLAVLEERQRLARDLHDSVAQALYGIALGARTARKYLGQEPNAATEPVDYVISLAAAGLAEMRALIFDLHPESLEQEGLVAAVNRQVSALRARHEVVVEPLTGAEPDVPLRVKEAVYGIIREALHNVMKHSQARNIWVTLETEGAGIAFSVRDDGIGFDPLQPAPGHLGLRSMQERAQGLGGRVILSSTPGEGTLISGTLPLAPAPTDPCRRAERDHLEKLGLGG